jgi:hypothetical protein
MKLLLFVVLLLLMHTAPVNAQRIAFSSTAFMSADIHTTATGLYYPHEYECIAARQGKRLLIGGGIELVAGGALILLAADLSRGITSPNDNAGLVPFMFGGLCLFGSAVCIAVGLPVYIGGKIHDKRNKHYSLIGNKNHAGIAYNFGR